MNNRARPPAELLTLDQAGAVLGRNRRTVLRMVGDGLFPAVNIARKPGDVVWRIKRADLDAFIAARTVKASPRRLTAAAS